MGIQSILSSAYSTATSSAYTEKAASLLLAGRGRTIMGLFADVTLEEKHKDELEITEHPTEVGAPIADHAYKLPSELSIKVGWSESAGRLNGMVGDTILSEDLGLVAIYEALQTLQDQRVKLIVSTGKRLYTNMLIKSLECTTDPETENVLIIDMTLRKIMIVNTSETTVLVDNQATPEATAQVQDVGTVQKEPVSDSWISYVTGGAEGGAFSLINPFRN